MADIFIAYARSDKARVQNVVNGLREAGFTVFIDVDITPGLKWAKVIEQQLDDAHCVLVIWSKQSVDRDYVIEEASRGRERQVLLPIMIDAVKIPLGFASYQASDLVAWDGLVDHPSWQQILLRADEIVSKSTGQSPRLPSKPQAPRSPSTPRPDPVAPTLTRTRLPDRGSRPLEDAVRHIGRMFFFRVVEPNPDVAIEPSPDLFFDQREQVFEDIYSNPPLEWIQGDLTSWYGEYRLATKQQIREQFRFDEPLFQFMDVVERVRFSNFAQVTVFLSLVSVLFSSFTKFPVEWIGRGIGAVRLPGSTLFANDDFAGMVTIHILAVFGFAAVCAALFWLFRAAQDYTEHALNAVLFAKIARIQDGFKTAIYRIDEEGQDRELTTEAGRNWAERSRWWTILAMWYARRLEGLTRYLAAVNFPSESQSRLGLLAGVAVSSVSAVASLLILFDGRFTPDLLASNTGLVRIGATLSVVAIAYLFLRRAQLSFRRIPLETRLVKEFRGLAQYEEIASIVYRDKIRIVTERDSFRRH